VALSSIAIRKLCQVLETPPAPTPNASCRYLDTLPHACNASPLDAVPDALNADV